MPDDDFLLDTSTIEAPIEPTGPTRKLLTHLEGDEFILRMDWSSLESWLACPRKAMWSLVHSRGGYKSAALTFGQAVHKGLESWYRFGDPDAALFDAELEMLKCPPSSSEWRNDECLRKTLLGYFSKYPSEPFTILDGKVEVPFELPLGTVMVDGYIPNFGMICENYTSLLGNTDKHISYVSRIHVQWTGKIDLMLSQNDYIWNLDHKTTSMGGPSFFSNFDLSQQFIGYTWAASELLQERVRGSILNVIFNRKPTVKGGGKSLEMERRYYEYSDYLRLCWRRDIMSHIENLIHSCQTESFPMNSAQCFGKYGECPFHKVCTMPDEESQTAMAYSGAFTRNTWNPLGEEN